MSLSSGNLAKIAYRFGKVSCLVCFAIFGRFWRFGGKWFSREFVREMTRNFGEISEVEKICEKWANGVKLPAP